MLKYKGILCSLVVGLVFGMGVDTQAGAILKVKPGGGPGYFGNVQAAINAAHAGDQVVLDPGIYLGSGNVDIDFHGKAITVRSTDPANLAIILTTVLDGGGNCRLFDFNSGETNTSVVAGLTITNGQGDYGGGISCTSGSSPLIRNCVIAGNRGSTAGGHIDSGGGIYCHGSDTNPLILNCFIVNNKTDESGAGVYCTAFSHPVIRNCTVYGNTAGTSSGNRGGGVYCNAATATVINSIFWSNTAKEGSQMAVALGGTLHTLYSDVQGGKDAIAEFWPGDLNWDTGCFNTDPNFVVASGDFSTDWNNKLHLADGSSCIDKGDPTLSYAGQTDIDGDPRVYNSRVDVGADEWPHWEELTVDSTPVKGEVFVDGTSWGTAPQTRKIIVGSHTISFGDVTNYDKPNDVTITLVKGTPQTVVGTYVIQKGTLTVNTTPVQGEIFVDDVSWGFGPQSKIVNVGPHTVRFGTVQFFFTPIDQTPVVTKDATTDVTGVYIAQTGNLSIDTTPIKGEVFVDTVSWGQAPISKTVDAGPHTISFGAVADYDTPPDQHITLIQGEPQVVNGTYVRQTGTLSITTTPVLGEIFVNDVSWGTAPVSRVVPTGSYTVRFGDMADYDKPGDQTAGVTKDQTTEISGPYVRQTGTLSITTTPVLGEIFVNDVSWGTGPVSRVVPTGSYAVRFGEVTDYDKPLDQTAGVTKDQTTEISEAYVRQTGTLSITTTPVQGEIFVNDVSWGTGPVSRVVPTGSYAIRFGEVAGYAKPGDQTAQVQKDQTQNVSGTYVVVPPDQGALSVDTTPVKGEVFVNDESWGTAPQTRAVPTGQYTVRFGPMAGYNPPANQTVTVTKAQTQPVTGEYTNQDIPAQNGTLTIDTTPVKGEVIVDGESWGTAPQTRDVTPGSHTVKFGPMAGYVTPSDETVQVVSGQTTQLLNPYIQPAPGKVSLSITLVGDGGVTPAAGEYELDSNQTLTAVPQANGWGFDHWEGDLTGSENPTVLKMTGNKNVTAVFTQLRCPILSGLLNSCFPAAIFPAVGILAGFGLLLGLRLKE